VTFTAGRAEKKGGRFMWESSATRERHRRTAMIPPGAPIIPIAAFSDRVPVYLSLPGERIHAASSWAFQNYVEMFQNDAFIRVE